MITHLEFNIDILVWTFPPIEDLQEGRLLYPHRQRYLPLFPLFLFMFSYRPLSELNS